jgi:hypothetical protein
MKAIFFKTTSVALTVSAICILAYLRALSCDFVNFDDHEFIINLVPIRTFNLEFLQWAFTTIVPIAGAWIPLNWISLAIDYQLWGGLNSHGFHLTSLLLHGANAFLVVLIADLLCRKRFAAVTGARQPTYLYPFMLLLSGLLFGLHPLRVEAVVWMTERRGVLNGLFSLGSILLYLRHVQQTELSGATSCRFSRYYLLSLLAFICSLMAKPISVVLPAMLLVLDWFPLGRLRKATLLSILGEKVPYLAIAAAVTAVTTSIGVKGGFISYELLSFGQRCILSGNAIFEYVRLTLIPIGILPQRIITSPFPVSYTVKTIAAIVAICLCLAAVRKRSWLTATMLLFLIPIVPVLSFFQANDWLYGPRYTYLPSVAVSIMAAYGIAIGVRGLGASVGYRSVTAICLTAALLVFYGTVTYLRIGDWRDSGTMWTRIITHQPFSRAYFLRGLYYVDSGKFMAAVDDYTTCLNVSVREKYPETYRINIIAHRGEAFAGAGRYEEAVRDFTTAIGMVPDPLYFYHRGVALKALGKMKEASEDFQRAGGSKGQMRWIVS